MDTSIIKITLLALADSVNPCAIAVLTMVLVAILIQNPQNKKKVLHAGLAFVSSIYVGYLFYGIILIQLFNSFGELLRSNTTIIYQILAIFAMILGALNIKDFFIYKKGNLLTEMPIFLRPKVKSIIEKITSTKGSFFIGILVTLFLLPCTIGPYIVFSGIIANLGILKALPFLFYYNLVFILPLLIIVLLIFYGFSKVDEVSGWKDRNIKVLHLIAGILLFLVGLALLMGWL